LFEISCGGDPESQMERPEMHQVKSFSSLKPKIMLQLTMYGGFPGNAELQGWI